MDSKINLICCNTLEEWHNWLKENHLKEKSIGIIINKKHTGKGTISHLDSMKEAICFGWIDTTIKRLDENKYIRHFRRRTDKSTWSENTLGYAKELLEQNRLYPEGLKRYKEGLAKPVLDHGIPKNPNTPKDVKNEIENNNLKKEFEKISKSRKKMHLRYILKAKTKETRKKRIAQLINSLKN
ncbi:MAG: YdeI/OmpD-associated family protein [Nanoarchaeota archaeon]